MRTAHATMRTMRTRPSYERDSVVQLHTTLCCALFELLFFSTIHGHCSHEFYKSVSKPVGPRKKKNPCKLRRHKVIHYFFA